MPVIVHNCVMSQIFTIVTFNKITVKLSFADAKILQLDSILATIDYTIRLRLKPVGSLGF